MKPEEYTLEELQSGLRLAQGCTTCIACGESFCEGEVYPLDGRFFTARAAAQRHLELSHPDYFATLLEGDSKYNPFTEAQKQILRLMQKGYSDKQIAAKLGLASPTVRHQKFTLREKCKTARYLLAVYGMAEAGGAEEYVPLHEHAPETDERFVTTKKAQQQSLDTYFTSLAPLRLAKLPAKEKKRIVVLARLAECFEPGRLYTEKQVNSILQEIYEDYVTLRRYLVEYGYLRRKPDGSDYQRV